MNVSQMTTSMIAYIDCEHSNTGWLPSSNNAVSFDVVPVDNVDICQTNNNVHSQSTCLLETQSTAIAA